MRVQARMTWDKSVLREFPEVILGVSRGPFLRRLKLASEAR